MKWPQLHMILRSLLIWMGAFYTNSEFVLAQPAINQNLHAHAKMYDEDVVTLDSLCAYLDMATRTELERIEIFFYWIAENISYDVESYISGAYKDNVNNPLRTRKGVCRDFALLFKRMCDIAGIECYMIDGYVKGYGYDEHDELSLNHVWNAIKINDEYRLIDVTWGSGHIVRNKDSLWYEKKIDLQYIYGRPDAFCDTHLPSHPMWQLKEEPLLFHEFHLTKSEFFEEERNSPYDYRKEIEKYVALSESEKQLFEKEKAYIINADEINLVNMVHALSKAGHDMAIADYAEEHIIKARQYFQRGLALLKEGELNHELLDEYTRYMNGGIRYSNYRLEHGR